MVAKSGLPAIRACLFDMDGLLINSEDLYTIATNAVLAEFGKPNLPWSIKAQLQGRPAPEASRIFHAWAQLPITNEEVAARTRAHQEHLFTTCAPLPGAEALLQTLSHTREPARVHIALATSSHRGNFDIKTRHLQDLFSVFPKESVVLGDDPRIGAGRGKPAPHIYLLALDTINARLRASGSGEREVLPEECLVFEDSVPGVEAGRRAGMQTVWCPHPGLLNEYRGREKEVLAGLTGEHKGGVEDVTVVDEKVKAVRPFARKIGAPGELDDGWAVLLHSLEDFDYEWFGITVPVSSSI